MADITVQRGQGVTQAIASHLGLSQADLKKVKLSTWQEVMSLVDQNNTQNLKNNKPSIFTGTNNVNKIGDKSTYQTNFVVHAGQQMQIDDGILSKIKQLLTGKAANSQQVADVKTQQPQNTAKVDTTEQTKETVDVKAASVDTAEQVQAQSKASKVFTTGAAAPVKNTEKAEEIKLGEQIHKTFDSFVGPDGNPTDKSLDVVSDSWRTLAGKKNRTDAENAQLDKEYTEGMKKMGSAYVSYIDSKFGDGSGVLSKEEYFSFESEDIPADLRNDPTAMKDIKTMQENAFKHLDINQDGAIDKKEMAAYFHALDFGTEEGKSNGANGQISAYDYAVNSAFNLPDPNENMLDQKLSYTYKKLFPEN